MMVKRTYRQLRHRLLLWVVDMLSKWGVIDVRFGKELLTHEPG